MTRTDANQSETTTERYLHPPLMSPTLENVHPTCTRDYAHVYVSSRVCMRVCVSECLPVFACHQFPKVLISISKFPDWHNRM